MGLAVVVEKSFIPSLSGFTTDARSF